MRLVLELTNHKDLEVLLPLLERLQISIIGGPEEENDKVSKWDFNKFYGTGSSNKSLDDLDRELEEMRNEWERDI